MTTAFQTVPFKALTAPESINARDAADYEEGIDELAAMIAAKGLLQPLIVRPKGKDKFEVMAGKRRFLAIGRLVKRGDYPVSVDTGEPMVAVCVRRENDEEALETSLIENIARRPMHPVDEFEVFAELHKGGHGADVDAIAKRYGITATVVRQRLALGSLAPEILAAWREDKLDAEQVQAFAVCRDPKKQVTAYKKLKADGWFNAAAIRRYFVQDKPSITDKRVQFVGLDRYKAAGGKLVESLFENDGYLENGDLLDRLTEERIAQVCEELVADGWSFAVSASTIKNGAHHGWARITGKVSYTPAEKQKLESIEAEREKLRELDNEGGLTDEESERWDELQEQQNVLRDAATARGFSKGQKAVSGCIVSVNANAVVFTYGVIRNKTQAQVDKEKQKAKAKATASSTNDAEQEADSGDDSATISNSLLVDIGALQTRAVAEALAQSPDLAILVAAAALAPSPSRFYGQSPVRLTVDGMDKYKGRIDEDDDAEDDKEPECGFLTAFNGIAKGRAAHVLAANLGRALDLRQQKHSASDLASCQALVAALPGAVYLKLMREKFDADDFFKRCAARVAVDALAEMGAPAPEAGAKKAVVAKQAADAARERGWLPVELRHPDYKLQAQARKKAA